MAILRSDLVIYKPEQLGNTDQAGGQRTNNPVVSGQLNNLFPPISDIDHAQSALQITKCYPTLDTAGTEQLIGAHVFINQPPVDPLVNVLLVESDDLTDATRRPGMVSILESARKLDRIAFPTQTAMVVGQSSVLVSGSASVAGIGFAVGAVIAIVVDYTGTESSTWPRGVHYAQVTNSSAGYSQAQGQYVSFTAFEPPLPFATPASNISVNAQTGVTTIRYTNASADSGSLKFHGVRTLNTTVAENSTALPVGSTESYIVPTITSQVNLSGIYPFSDGQGRLVRTSAIQTATSAVVYNFNLPDILENPWFESSDNPPFELISYVSESGTISNAADITVVGATVTVALSSPPKVGTVIELLYVSSSNHNTYVNNSENVQTAMPAGYSVIPGEVRLARVKFNGSIGISPDTYKDCYDAGGGIMRTTDSGNNHVASINYATGQIAMVSGSSFYYAAIIVSSVEAVLSSVNFTLASLTPKLDTIFIRALTENSDPITASCDAGGVITGLGISGNVSATGLVSLTFTTPILADTLNYDVVSISETLPPSELFGINSLLLANDGLVPVFRKFGVIAIQHSQFQSVTGPAPAQVKTIRTGARFVDIVDSTGASLWTANNEHYTVDSDAGTVTLNSNFPGFTGPFVLTDTIGELGMAADVTTTEVLLQSPLTREYPAGATVASVQDLDDLGAVASEVFDMSSWNGDWDTTGTPANGNLNTAAYPIELNNRGAINEDWAIVFTSGTAFNVIGKGAGLIASGDTLNDLAPVNTKVGQPYFIIRSPAFGGGWNAGEAIRFRTFAAAKPVMLLRVVKSGHSQITTDRTVLSFRGNEA